MKSTRRRTPRWNPREWYTPHKWSCACCMVAVVLPMGLLMVLVLALLVVAVSNGP